MFGLVVLLLVVIGLVLMYASTSTIVLVGIVLFGLVAWIVARAVSIAKYNSPSALRTRLVSKYQDETIADRIMAAEYWIGQTEDQLIDSLGMPTGRDIKQTRNARHETWTYSTRGGLKISMEDGVVTAYHLKR